MSPLYMVPNSHLGHGEELREERGVQGQDLREGAALDQRHAGSWRDVLSEQEWKH